LQKHKNYSHYFNPAGKSFYKADRFGFACPQVLQEQRYGKDQQAGIE
jgi:hypothetical protein